MKLPAHKKMLSAAAAASVMLLTAACGSGSDDASTDTRVHAEAGTGAVIGTLSTTPEVFAVGAGTTYECPAQGDLMLGINDTDLADNSGEFAAFVTLNQ